MVDLGFTDEFTLWQSIVGTVILCVLIGMSLLIDVYLLFRRRTRIGKKKFVSYLVMCNLGCLFYVLDQIGPMWLNRTYYTPPFSFTWIFYFLGYPSMYVPILLRSWRVVCCYKKTLNFNCTWTTPMQRKRRGDLWFIIRHVLLLLPFMLLYPWVFLTTLVDFAVLPMQLVLIIINFSLAIVHCTLRKKLIRHDLDETKALVVYGLALFAFWVTDIVLWYLVLYYLQLLRIGSILYIIAKLGLGFLFIIPPFLRVLKADLFERKKKNEEEEIPPPILIGPETDNELKISAAMSMNFPPDDTIQSSPVPYLDLTAAEITAEITSAISTTLDPEKPESQLL